MVPAIQPIVERLYLFQREPGWVLPKGERDFTDEERISINKPWRRRRERWRQRWMLEKSLWRGHLWRPGTKINEEREGMCRRYIARVFDLIVFVARLRDGRRCLLEISELRGVDEGGHYQLAQVFRTDVRPLGTGCQVHFGPIQVEDLGRRMLDKLERQGIRWTC